MCLWFWFIIPFHHFLISFECPFLGAISFNNFAVPSSSCLAIFKIMIIITIIVIIHRMHDTVYLEEKGEIEVSLGPLPSSNIRLWDFKDLPSKYYSDRNSFFWDWSNSARRCQLLMIFWNTKGYNSDSKTWMPKIWL